MYQENPNDYSRDERLGVSWWSSRRGRGGRGSTGGRTGRRITLIDMLLLAVAAGVLVPWILSMDRGVALGDYTVEVNVRERRTDSLIRIEFVLAGDADTSDEQLIGWSLRNDDGKDVFGDRDLPPRPGNSRIFRYIGVVEESWTIVLYAGDENRTIRVEE